MPTAAELQIIIETQDRASAQLRQVGAEVQRLSHQVEQSQRSMARSGGLLGGLTGGLGVGAGLQAFQTAMGGVSGVMQAISDSIFRLNSELEQSVATFTALTGSVGAAQQVVAALRREAATSPFGDAETIAAGRTLITVADGTTESLVHLVQVAEQLAAIDPAQGLAGAAVALREALGGDFASLAERFELSRQALQRFRDQGLSNLQAVEAELQRLGVTSELVERLGRSFEGRKSTILSFFDEIRQRLGSGVFSRVSDLFGHMVNLIAEHGDRLRQWAENLGQTIGALLERLATVVQGPLRALVSAFDPGLWQSINDELARVPEAVEQTSRAAQEAGPRVQDLNRQLAGMGVAAAEVQLQADRVRRAYDDQLAPLERQLQLLQQSTDIQRVQSALATNRATVDRLRLQGEISALQRAAGGVVDPNAPGLTLRQRAIALALEERRLRLQELGLEEERRPLVQSLQEQIAAIQRQQREALAPLERDLAIRKEQVDALNVQRQTAELLKQDLEAAATSMRKTWDAMGGEDAAAAARKRGEELAQAWLDGWQKWIEAGGGTVWGAMGKTLEDWYQRDGKPLADRIGTDLGTTLGTAAAVAAQSTFGKWVADLLKGGGSTAVGVVVPPVATATTEAVANVVRDRGITITFLPGAIPVTVGREDDPNLLEAFKIALADFVKKFFAAAATTDPGASSRQQGSGRAGG